MARTKPTPTTSSTPGGFLSRLRARPPPRQHVAAAAPARKSKVTHEESTNPITGTHTSTTKRKTKPAKNGVAAATRQEPPVSHPQRRKPGIGDKLSGAVMQAKGQLEGRPGLEAAGTRRMRGTDGKGMRRR